MTLRRRALEEPERQSSRLPVLGPTRTELGMNTRLITEVVLLAAIAFQRTLGFENQREPVFTAEQRLMKKLFSSSQYDSRARPVLNFTVPVYVTVRLNLYQLVEVDERSQHVILYTWVTQMWDDSMLTWNPQDYDGVSSLVVPYDDVWLPDTYLYNSLKMSRQDSERWISAILEVDPGVNGSDHSSVVFRYPALYKFMCSMDVTYFPFDTQHCRMIFGSWTYDSSGIVFMPETNRVAQEDYQENEEWVVVELSSRNHSEMYGCCPNPFSFIYVDMVLKRRPLHYLVNLFVPILIVSAIANIGFFSPSSTDGAREQKVGLGMSTLLALSIILMMVSDQMPTTSTSVPLVGRFFVGIMIQTALALLATTGILMVHQRGLYGHRVPAWIKRIMFGCVAPALGVERRKPLVGLPDSQSLEGAPLLRRSESGEFSPKEKPRERQVVDRLLGQMSELQFVLSRKYRHLVTEDNSDKLDWEWLACILDRIFLLLSLLSVILLCGLIIFLGSIEHFLGK